MDNADIHTVVSLCIRRACQLRASDIHIEPTIHGGVRIRYRIDGLLSEYIHILQEYALRCVTHIKVMAHLDIGERRLPQDGKYAFELNEKIVDIRVATFPTIGGEAMVLRILEQVCSSNRPPQLEHLGMPATLCSELAHRMRQSQGLYIITGPTGSGKSTTLYEIARSFIKQDRLLITLEDPVEYSIPGALQAHVRTDIGFSFAEGIRAVIRQDPDAIMVGEMRDRDTVETALRASLTGHLVLTTLHTTDAISALIRLKEMGSPTYLIAAVVSGVIAQRLIRLLCRACAREEPYDPYTHPLPSETLIAPKTPIFLPTGCDICHYRGYQGRTGLFEWFMMDDYARKLFLTHQSEEGLRHYALQKGMTPLMLEGIKLVKEGSTSVEELLRVVS